MCDFISWKEVTEGGETHLFYLTDEEVFSKEGLKKFKECRDNDVIGHGAIDLFFALHGAGKDHEVRDFWNTDKFPKEIAEKLKSFDAHWGKMWKSGAFQADDLQYIVENGPKEWKERAKLQLEAQRFPLLKEFSLTVPADYHHATELSMLNPRDFYFFNEALTDENFKRATQKLVPGKTYKAKIFGIGNGFRVSSEDCLALYTREHALMTGAQGLSLVYRLKKKELPKGKWTTSFDEKDALWKDAGGYHWVPCVDAHSDSGFLFLLGSFECDWSSGYCVLCLCDEPAYRQAGVST